MDPSPAPAVVEVAVERVDDAVEAVGAGADRLELCADLNSGGLTPSAGVIRAVRESVDLPLMVLIRPRAGGFTVSPPELDAMGYDIAVAHRSGADGVVLGALTADGGIARDVMARLVDRARPLAVTFHRAFDLVSDRDAALESLIGLGVERVLTAGGAATALEGASVLADLVRRAAGRITVMGGGGVRAQSVERLLDITGLREIHLGPRTLVQRGRFGDEWRLDRSALEQLVTRVRARG